MTKEQMQQYRETTRLRAVVNQLKGQKYKLDCGHHVTFGHHLGNDITIRQNGRIVCSQCGYEGE